MNGYYTNLGQCLVQDSLKALEEMEDGSIDLIVTSPPFSLQRHKAYGEVEQHEYVDWLLQFGKVAYRKLKDTGSLVMEIGGAYQKGKPVKSLYPFRFMIKMCDDVGFHLAQDFYWHNPSALPAPIEWVNKRKLRTKTSVSTIWWFSKTEHPKADITKVLVPYSDRMKKLINKPENFIKEEGTVRPSGHVMGKQSWTKDNGGAIPSNLLQISNSESNTQYLRHCKELKIKGHPARFPAKFPEFFIKMLTEEGDLVVDIFSGSNTTGQVAEELNRRWLSFDTNQEYVAASVFRFIPERDEAKRAFEKILTGEFYEVQKELNLF